MRFGGVRRVLGRLGEALAQEGRNFGYFLCAFSRKTDCGIGSFLVGSIAYGKGASVESDGFSDEAEAQSGAFTLLAGAG